ncbi:MAG: iron-containing alcohol dehydrogenase [Candidatus Thermoplasmatota archaeon]|nr:iron-containing alcohol dehydrogenase [Candidatus Thermoplasmatota archaeon]
MKIFGHYNPVELYFGTGTLEKVGGLAKKYGNKALIVTGRHSMKESGALDRLLHYLNISGVETDIFDEVEPNPSYTTVDRGASMARKCDIVIGLGGGSAMDAAKAISISASNNLPISSFYSGEEPTGAIPVIEIATTAGTGSEADRYFVLTNPETKEKHGRGYRYTYPVASIVDPSLMKTMPPRLTASTGIDAFFHGLESYVSKISTPFSELYAKEAMNLVAKNIENAYRNGSDIDGREKMALASTLAGMAIDGSRTTLLHALEHPVSGHLGISHGEGLAALSMAYMEFTYPACPEKFARIARLLGEEIDKLPMEEAARKSVRGVKNLLDKVDMNLGLADIGVEKDMIDIFVEDARKSHLVKINPRSATPEDMKEIYYKSL